MENSRKWKTTSSKNPTSISTTARYSLFSSLHIVHTSFRISFYRKRVKIILFSITSATYSPAIAFQMFMYLNENTVTPPPVFKTKVITHLVYRGRGKVWNLILNVYLSFSLCFRAWWGVKMASCFVWFWGLHASTQLCKSNLLWLTFFFFLHKKLTVFLWCSIALKCARAKTSFFKKWNKTYGRKLRTLVKIIPLWN